MAVLGDWKKKDIDFSRKIKTPGWCIQISLNNTRKQPKSLVGSNEASTV